MNLVVVVMGLAILQLLYFAFQVGGARGRLGVKAPTTTGNEEFERYFRVQQNTIELLVVFLPALWMFASYISTLWAAILGFIYIVGRFAYSYGYVRDASKRSAGFTVSFLPTVVLLVGGLVGAIRAVFLTGI